MPIPTLTRHDCALLADTFLFRGLSQAETLSLLAGAGVTVERFAGGEAIYTPTAFRRSLGVLLSGSATVRKRAAGGAMLVSVLERGALFGAAALFSPQDAQEEYLTEICARGAVRALLIPEEALRSMLRADFRLTERYLGYLTGRIRFLNRRMEGFICPSVEERLMQFLLNNADEQGRVQLGYSFTALAEALCVGRASLYRALDTLAAQGRLRREEGRRLVLLETNAGEGCPVAPPLP